MLEFVLNKYNIWIFIGLLLWGTGKSQVVSAASLNGLSHFISLSFAGGEGNTISFGHEPSRLSTEITDLAGANAQFSLAYEMQYRMFIANIGLSGSYFLTRQQVNNQVSDDFTGVHKKQPYIYSYVYSLMSDRQQTVYAELPIQIGLMFNSGVYALVGTKFKLNVFNTYQLNTRMHTVLDMTASGAATVFDGSKASVDPEGTMGVCPPMDYLNEGTYNLSKLNVALTAEVGYKIPLPMSVKRTAMRVGAFFEYGMPVPAYTLNKNANMGKYGSATGDYLNNTTSQLHSSTQLPSVLEMGKLNKFSHMMAVGVRFTILFDVTDYSFPCHCYQ